MKKCMIIFLGLSRTFNITQKNIYDNVFLPNADECEFNLIINSEYLDDYVVDFFNNIYCNYRIINFNIDKTIIKSSTYAINLRLYNSLMLCKNEHYDIYMNLRFDLTFNENIIFNNYSNMYCIIPSSYISANNCFHNRDWDLCAIGDSNAYLAFNYKYLYDSLTNWCKIIVEKNIHSDVIVTICDDEVIEINNKVGLITNRFVPLVNKCIKFLMLNNHMFVMSDNGVNCQIIRKNDYTKSF